MDTPAVIIDVREAVSLKRTGKGQWTRGLVEELINRGTPLVLVSRDPLPPQWNRPHVRSVRFPETGLRWHWSVLRWLRTQGPCTYLSPTSFIVPAFAPHAVRTAVVVHDLIAFRPDAHDRRARRIERLLLPRALKKASVVFCISDSTRKDLLRQFPRTHAARVFVVLAGPGPLSAEPWRSDDCTILCVATLCPRKNQLRLIQAYAALPEDVRANVELVLAGGRGWDDQPILEEIEKTSGVSWLGYVSDERYRELLNTCAVFAYPSLYEGFGLPVLDAMERGVPVLTSDRGSLREVAGDGALIANPEDTVGLTVALHRLLADADLRAELSQKGRARAAQFSWKRVGDAVCRGLASVLP